LPRNQQKFKAFDQEMNSKKYINLDQKKWKSGKPDWGIRSSKNRKRNFYSSSRIWSTKPRKDQHLNTQKIKFQKKKNPEEEKKSIPGRKINKKSKLTFLLKQTNQCQRGKPIKTHQQNRKQVIAEAEEGNDGGKPNQETTQ
jgi:hypothetical protein